MNNFILIKKDCTNRHHKPLLAEQAVKLLLNWGGWPLWQRTKCRKMVKSGDRLCIYVTGCTETPYSVIASAVIDTVEEWTFKHDRTYPLTKEDIPSVVLNLRSIHILEVPFSVKENLPKLSFPPKNRKKWGAVLVGGIRTINDTDFEILTQSKTPNSEKAA